MPEPDEAQTAEAARSIPIAVGAYWTYAHPPQAMQAAYDLDPALVFLPDRFEGSLARVADVLILGILAA
ncbi:MAG: hypothetical protein JST33_13330 [Actinobacteria bacterium]|nr:hypothetical protein [Actinomycetota bacterium]